VNAVAATSDVFRITGVVILPGIQAPSAARSPFIMRPYDQELVTCRRYYQKTGGGAADTMIGGYNLAGNPIYLTVSLTPTMRAAPTVSSFGTFINQNVQTSNFYPGTASWGWGVTPTVTGACQLFNPAGGGIILDARL
jgi:hypothetical protein